MAFANKEYFYCGGMVFFYDDMGKIDKLPKVKENAVLHYIAMIRRSWTFNRMTEQEQTDCMNIFLRANAHERIKGSFDARWEILQNMYDAFLSALGYYHDCMGWREADEN